MDVLVRMEGFWVSILFLLLYFFVTCEHLGRLFQSSLQYLQVKPDMGLKCMSMVKERFSM